MADAMRSAEQFAEINGPRILYEVAFHEMRVPTLIIAGDPDQPHVLASAEHFKASLPDAEVVIMPGTAHLPSVEQPAEFTRLVVDFVQNRTIRRDEPGH